MGEPNFIVGFSAKVANWNSVKARLLKVALAIRSAGDYINDRLGHS